MTDTRSIALLGLLVTLGCRESAETCDSGEPGRPNILLIVADDLGFTDLGAFGSEIATPNLDRLALRGLRFTNFHAASSCAPSRAMLISGVTNAEAGVMERHGALEQHVSALPALLREAGYHTYMAGKWHLGQEADQSPAARGFESSFALVRAGDNHLGASLFPKDDVAYRENENVVRLPDRWFSSRLYTDKLIDYIRANEGDGSPWFGYLAFTAPHWPLQLPEDWIDRYAGRYEQGYDTLRTARVVRARELGVLPDGLGVDGFHGTAPAWEELDEESRKRYSRAMEIYAAMVENMDSHVGRALDYLRESEQLDETIIIFLSDNGAAGSESSFRPSTIPRTDWDSSLPNMGREGSFVTIGRGWAEAATAPYRGVKGVLNEGGMLAAAFVSHNTVANKGGIDHSYVTIMDVLPTLLDVAGTSHLPIRGRSFWPRVQGDIALVHPETDVIPWMTSADDAALVRGEWKILKDDTDPDIWRLYNLANDPGERNDLSAAHPELKTELVAAWNDYAEGL